MKRRPQSTTRYAWVLGGVLLASLSLPLAAQTPPAPDIEFQEGTTNYFITNLPATGIVFSQETGIYGWMLPERIRRFTPTPAEIIAAEPLITSVVPYLQTTGTGYVRQYIGYVDEGHKFLFVNFICARMAPHYPWQSAEVLVNDGGKCFFSMKLDMEKKQIFDLTWGAQ